MKYTLQKIKMAMHSGVIAVVFHVSCLRTATEV